MKADNNIDRVVNNARRSDAILYWQCVDHRTNRLTYVDDIDLPSFEREGVWLITPVLDLSKVDINGVSR